GKFAMRGPMPPSAPVKHSGEELCLLGESLKARAEDVLRLTVTRTGGSGHDVDAVVQDSFERISRSSTIAVARWVAGEGLEVAREAGQETWEIFGEVAAHSGARLNEGKRREEELAFLATRDPWTGLPNRTLILDRVEQMLARSRRNQTPVAALFIDIDNFKGINDTLGHAVGDELLRAVAARLEGVIRDVDALGRLGGDEFVVISEDLSLAAGAELIAERLLDALQQPFTLGAAEEARVSVTASVGIATGEGISAEELLRDADIAMYSAKWDGKAR